MQTADAGVTAQHRASFFEYISIREEPKEEGMFTLAKMKVSKLGTEGMIAIQCSLFSAWVDKLRTINSETTVAILNSIPDFCVCPAVLRLGKHKPRPSTRKENTRGHAKSKVKRINLRSVFSKDLQVQTFLIKTLSILDYLFVIRFRLPLHLSKSKLLTMSSLVHFFWQVACTH